MNITFVDIDTDVRNISDSPALPWGRLQHRPTSATGDDDADREPVLQTVHTFLNTQALHQIPVYTVILLLSVAGNALVILTLVKNRRMRTITNVFLLNLAVSDLLLGVLCMPITLVGALLRDFVFGGFMCMLMPYLQGG